MLLRHTWSCNVMKSAVYLRIEERDLLSVFTLFSLTLRLISKFRNAVRPSFSPILSHSCFSRRKKCRSLSWSFFLSLSLLSQSFRNVEGYFSRLLFALFPTFISLYRIICFTNAHFQRSPSRPSASPMTRIPLYLHSRDILALTSFTNPCHSIIQKDDSFDVFSCCRGRERESYRRNDTCDGVVVS